MNKKYNPENVVLDPEEQWHEDHADEFVAAHSAERESLIKAARNTLDEIEKKSERMNIRMTKADMEALKRAARREGIPYQSLVTSILHKFTRGGLVDIDEARKLLR